MSTTEPQMTGTEHQPDPSEWTMQMSEGGETYPFVEDENANITGLGHQDPAQFVAAVNRYETECNGEPFPEHEQWDEGYIGHTWVTLDPDGERLHPCTRDQPEAIAVTTLWGQR